MNKIEERLNLARKELLDLSLRNPLLNYRLRAASGLEFPYMNASDVFNYIVNEGKSVYFTVEKSNNPSKIFVDMPDKEMHRRLLRTYRDCKMFMEEKGANILFLALGFLKWNESEGGPLYRAPLILVPVELKKVNGQDKFYLQYNGEEIRPNISLITKMQSEYAIDISYDYNEDDEIKGVDEYLRKVDSTISTSSKPDWVVETSCGAFDFFSFSKFLMYKDLDISLWIDNKKKLDNDVLHRLFETNFDDKLDDEATLRQELSPHKIYNVVDADSSQASVVCEINRGKNMVIQGPPGTGKSQTITNIIASSVANGKSVLFVAEKKAALDVVKNRLEKVGIGDLALELHSQKTNKTDVLKSIEKTINLGALKARDDDMLKTKYDDVKSEISQYSDIVNAVLDKSQVKLIDVYGNALQIKDKMDRENNRFTRIHFKENIAEWPEADFKKKLDLVKEYISLLKYIGKVEKHPFYGVELKECLPYEQVAIKEKINDLEDGLLEFISVVGEIGAFFDGGKSTNTIFDSVRLINSIDALEKYAETTELTDLYLIIYKDDVDNYIKAGKEIQAFKSKLVHYQNNIHREYDKFISMYDEYQAVPYLKKSSSPLRDSMSEYLADKKFAKGKLEDLYVYLCKVKTIKDNEDKLKSLFGDMYVDMFRTDWKKVDRAVATSRKFLALVDNYSVLLQTKDLVKDRDSIQKLLELRDKYFDKRKYFEDNLNDFLTAAKFNFAKRFNSPVWFADMPFNELKKVILGWKNNLDSIVEIVRYNDLTEKFHQFGLKPLLDHYYQTGKYDNMDDILSYEYYDALINLAYSKFGYLSQFKEYKFERIIDNFKELDSKLIVENIKYILKKHYEDMPHINDNDPKMNIIRREIQKKKNQMPIRRLFSKTGSVIQKIKPVFMMSPISIASFLPPKEIIFDLVVFDEASQVRPVEAFGALLRAKQIVVVGDSKQLPPTTFFDTMTSKLEDMNNEDYDVANMESILSLLLAKNIPQKTLSWHYRSRNQSLISVSNNEFYSQTLRVFPSVFDKDPNQGLVFNYLPNTVYDRGGTRANKLEAQAVIKAVFKHAEEHPNMSIGVVSFSLSQQEELYREFDSQLKKRNDPKLNDYFDLATEEPFFIKNLESVQGDERDVIFISLGYGFDQDRHLTMEFGPLNKEGGERRLNVLITRAKYKCIVFSNITSHDINLSKTSATGVVVLKRFLEYAQNRVIFLSKNKEVNNSAFVDYLNQQLLDYGYDVDRSIASDISIDLAIFDKDLNRFTVGIECDGDVYKKIPVENDRERIRKSVLRNLGWKIYHVYAPDFYRNPRNEFNKLLDFIQEAKKDEEITVSAKTKVSIERKQSTKTEKMDLFVPYKSYSGPKRRSAILSDENSLKALVEKIVECEAPIHFNMLKNALKGITKVDKITDDQTALLQNIIREDPDLDYRDDFVYDVNQTKFEVRNRELLSKYCRNYDFIAEEEYAEYVFRLLNSGEATNRDEIFKMIPEVLGIAKSKAACDRIGGVIDSLIDKKKLYVEKDIIYINEDMQQGQRPAADGNEEGDS